MLTEAEAESLDHDLKQFSGTDNYYRHWTGRIIYTDGVTYLAEKAGAFWLIDLIASHQTARLRQEEFQIWKLVVDRDKRPMAVATCQADKNWPVIIRQEIEYTDFPLPSIKLYLAHGVLMLPGEYWTKSSQGVYANMARLMSQVKGGFYAAPPEAVATVIERLKPADRGETIIFDPCAGEGRALLQLAEALKATAYGIELSEDRASIVRNSLPEDQSLAPADFLRCSISHRSFSFVWCNPPYDFAAGGEGRVENQFIERAANLLVDGGVLALVCPEDVARTFGTNTFFDERFERVSAMAFPEAVRKFNETIILGCKRRNMAVTNGRYDYQWLEKRLEQQFIYKLPAGLRPKTFRKTEPTDTELSRLVAHSPLRFHLERPADTADHRPRPPMSPGIGHRAMLLASGHIDGLISPPNEPPHVIRGTATKDKYIASCDSSEDDNGNVTTRTVISEKPRLVIRVLDAEGTITTLE